MKSIINVVVAIILGCSFGIAQLRPGISREDQQQIENQISTLFGDLFEISDVMNIDSSKGRPWITGSQFVQDPYGTLAQSFVFLAEGRHQRGSPSAKGFVGIFKQGQIIWHSDTLVDNKFVVAAGLLAIRDLNRDGTVDLVTSWYEGNQGHIRNIWIFSWDGQTGRLITALDEKNRSSIVSRADDLKLADVNGDGILEIQGKWRNTQDPSLYEPVIYSWNGQLYGKWSNPPQPPSDGSLPKDKADLRVWARITKSKDRYSFHYVIQNSSSSLQKLQNFAVVRLTGAISKGIGRRDWKFDLWNTQPKLAGWIDLFGTNLLEQGVSDSSFRFETPALPAIVPFYAQGNNGKQSFSDLFVNSNRGVTLGPADPPDPFLPAAFLDTIASYKQRAVELGWITKTPGIAKSLHQKLENAKAQIQKGNTKSARNILHAFVNEVEALNKQGDKMTSEGYALLKFNVEYLIGKL